MFTRMETFIYQLQLCVFELHISTCLQQTPPLSRKLVEPLGAIVQTETSPVEPVS